MTLNKGHWRPLHWKTIRYYRTPNGKIWPGGNSIGQMAQFLSNKLGTKKKKEEKKKNEGGGRVERTEGKRIWGKKGGPRMRWLYNRTCIRYQPIEIYTLPLSKQIVKHMHVHTYTHTLFTYVCVYISTREIWILTGNKRFKD